MLAVACVGGIIGGLLVHLMSPAFRGDVQKMPANVLGRVGPEDRAVAPTAAIGSLEVSAAIHGPATVDATAYTPMPSHGAPDPDAVIGAIRGGDERLRLAALEAALAHDVELPPGLLVETYERPGSEELRLLAFERHIDLLATEVENARAAMIAAIGSDSVAVRAEASRRLDQLAAYEAMLVAEPAAQGARP